VIATLGVIHFWMIVKSDVFYPALFGIALAILLGYRLVAGQLAKPVPRKVAE
jgi:sulfoxide reductase heme-binding subunit YedZ